MLLSTAAGGLVGADGDHELIGDAEIGAVVHHSGHVVAGALFCCIPGARVDGHDLAEQAVAAGAVALLVERRLPLDVPQLVVGSVRAAVGPIASRFHGDPSRAMTVIGITGTNGKTTTVNLIRSIMEAAGRRCEVIGTLTSQPGGPPTTPDAPELQAQLAAWRDAGVDVVAMEVSSHALAMHRVDGTWFSATGFTTLGSDHLDLHGDIDHYFAAKARLFRPELTARAVIRADDDWGAVLLAGAVVESRPFRAADAEPVRPTPRGMEFHWHDRPVALPMDGRHNVANAQLAAELCSWLDVADDDVVAGLEATGVVRGRFELVDGPQPFTVAIDYAHTPDALEVVLDAARDRATLVGGRVIVVFGCGGDRDRSKRPEMGRIAARSADVVVVTSDNPRSEPPAAILEEILGGIGDRSRVTAIEDRAAAIHHAIRAAGDDDVVVIAGKGHETTQTFADRTIAFDDHEVATQAIEAVFGP